MNNFRSNLARITEKYKYVKRLLRSELYILFCYYIFQWRRKNISSTSAFHFHISNRRHELTDISYYRKANLQNYMNNLNWQIFHIIKKEICKSKRGNCTFFQVLKPEKPPWLLSKVYFFSSTRLWKLHFLNSIFNRKKQFPWKFAPP